MNFFKNLFKPDPEVDFQMALREDTLKGNYEKAVWLYEKAAKMGHAKAQFYCGYMYLQGRGTIQDKGKAFDYIFNSANGNYPKAQYLLSQMYLRGEGVFQNLLESDKWMSKFKEHNIDSSALSFLDL